MKYKKYKGFLIYKCSEEGCTQYGVDVMGLDIEYPSPEIAKMRIDQFWEDNAPKPKKKRKPKPKPEPTHRRVDIGEE